MMDRLGSKSAIAAAVFWLGLGNWSAAEALTIYRIGGELAPLPPEVQEGKAEFRQLSWEDVDPELGGGSEGVRQDQDGIEPLFFGPNESLTQTIEQRGGYLQRHVYSGFTEDDKVNPIADGDPTTSYEELQPIESDHTVFGTDFLFDLGGLFPVNRVKFYPPPGKEDRVVEAALVGTSTGKEDPNSIPIQHRFQSRLHGFGIVLDIVGEITENKQPVVEIELPGKPIRYLLVHTQPQEQIWEIAEIEIYTEGYIPTAFYRSNIIDLGASSNLGWIRWSGRQDLEARVDIRTQSGDDVDPNLYWRKTFRGDEQVTFGTNGRELTKQAYERLEIAQRGEVTHDTANWEIWSSAYNFADSLGSSLSATKPHQFVQFEVDFTSVLLDGGRLNYLEFAVSPRKVTDLVGEIDPARAELATLTSFTYAVRPVIEPDDGSFDRLDLRLAGGRIARVEQVRIAGQEEAHEVMESEEDRVVIGFPRIDVGQSGELLEVVVDGEIFRFGAYFSGSVLDSETPEDVGQQIRAGDATEALDSNGFLVQSVSPGKNILGQLLLDPPVFTPNGDDINDQVAITYDLFKVTSSVPVRVEIWDLNGRLVREIYAGQDQAGRYPRLWDGRTPSGALVPPGLYICQIVAEAEEGEDRRMGVISVAY